MTKFIFRIGRKPIEIHERRKNLNTDKFSSKNYVLKTFSIPTSIQAPILNVKKANKSTKKTNNSIKITYICFINPFIAIVLHKFLCLGSINSQ